MSIVKLSKREVIERLEYEMGYNVQLTDITFANPIPPCEKMKTVKMTMEEAIFNLEYEMGYEVEIEPELYLFLQ